MRKLLIALVSAGLLSSRNASGQGKPTSVRGAWQVIQVTMTGPARAPSRFPTHGPI